MSSTLKLTMDEFERMVARGAFDQLSKKVELIHGELLEMNPAGPVHDDIVEFLTRWSTDNTSSKEVGVRVQCSLGIPDLDSVPEPDIVWVRRRRYRERHPQPEDVLLLIEVADSSAEYDLDEKQKLYAAAGVREYWVVNVVDKCIHLFRQPGKRAYRHSKVYRSTESITPLAQSKAVLYVGQLFAEDNG